jgi:hypothetical protein
VSRARGVVIGRLALIAVFSLIVASCNGDAGGTGAAAGGDVAEAPTATTIPLSQLLGKVVDESGAPVPRAEVAIGEHAALTAADGWFDLMTSPGPLTVDKHAWVATEGIWDGSPAFTEWQIQPQKIRALRVGAEAAGNDERYAAMLSLADETAINAFVFDTKQEGGKVFYNTAVQDAHDSGAVVNVYDPAERIAQAKEHGLYTITRIVTFEDSYRAAFRPEQAYDGKWINPTKTESWEYPLALAEEACRLGFDEVQFDYVRFPSEEAAQISGQLEMTEEQRTSTISGFIEAAKERVHAAGCAVSADVFAIVVSAQNDQGIGQMPETLTRHLDAFSPMVYPSHYSPGWLGLDDPNEHPYDVTEDAIVDAQRRIEPGVVLRPWLQAFWWTNDQIRTSIQAAEDNGVGWILWNAVSNFDRAALPTDEELAAAAAS